MLDCDTWWALSTTMRLRDRVREDSSWFVYPKAQQKAHDQAYQYIPKLMLTAGFSYDSSMSDSDTRPIMIPIGAMYRYGVGFKYKKSDDLLLGGGLSFLWEGDLEVKPSGDAQRGFVTGQYDNVSLTFLSFYAQW
jgi:hypothetical protein